MVEFNCLNAPAIGTFSLWSNSLCAPRRSYIPLSTLLSGFIVYVHIVGAIWGGGGGD